MARPNSESNRPAPRWLRATRWFLIAVVGVLLIFGYQLAELYTDSAWFAELGQSTVFRTTVTAKLQLFFGFGTLFYIFVWFNLWVARRVNAHIPGSRPLRMTAADEERDRVVEMLRRGADRSSLWFLIVAAVLVAANSAGQWSDYLLFTHAASFHKADPIFGNDIGFYVFRLPFLSFLQSWFLFAVLAGLVFASLYHLSQGAMDLAGSRVRVEPAALRHVMALAGVAAMVYAWGIVLDRYGLLYRENGPFFGAGYTDLHARLPALNLEAFGMGLTGVLCLVALRARNPLRLPLIGVGVWAVGLLIVGGIYPIILQNYSVTPNQQSKERPYIGHDIEFTQRAYGLDKVQVQDFPAGESLTAAQLAANRATIDNIRLWDWPQLGAVYTVRQALRSFYRFSLPESEVSANGEYNIDVDRYHLGSEYKQVMLGARELNVDALPSGAKTWQNQRLQYTHGYGAVMSPVHRVDTDGLPEYLMSGMPIQTSRPELKLAQPQIYFGELTSSYAFVGSKEREFDYPLDVSNATGQSAQTQYAGKGGVPLGGGMSRLAWSMRLGDTNMLLSSDLSDQSRILFRRNIRERVEELAPYLRWDQDPYLIVDGGRLLWMIDGYTVSDRYPYSKPIGTRLGENDSGFNYIRNSVKAVVDAYDGTVTLYTADPSDPIVATWSRIYPGLYKPLAKMAPSVQAHLRYPEDLFRIQRDIYTIYHISNPDAYYLKDDAWDVPVDPTTGVDASGQPTQSGRMAPYYVVMKLPGATDEEFLLMSPFTPLSQGNSAQNLAAWMAVRCDPQDYGKLLVYRFPKGTNVNGPQQALALIRKQEDVSQFETLMGQKGSKVIFGNMLIIPVETALLYCVPVYVQATGSGSVPGLLKVIVSTGKQIVMRPTLDEAIAALGAAGGAEVVDGSATTPPPGPRTLPVARGTIEDRVQRTNAAYRRARQKQQEYNRALDDLGRALDDLQQALQTKR